MIVKSVILVFVSLFSVGAWAAYDQSWHQVEFWSGEYPNGIAVISPSDAVLPARTAMDRDLPSAFNASCPSEPFIIRGIKPAKLDTFRPFKLFP